MPFENLDAARSLLTEALESVRPYLKEDGGDVELVSVSPDGIVEVRFLGECARCSLSIMTLRAGIERTLMLACPDVRRIEMVS
ncbi:MAG: NifU family protein [Bacteroidetes bacterium]|nr:NifU family protein [Bacteroidota bacterium]